MIRNSSAAKTSRSSSTNRARSKKSQALLNKTVETKTDKEGKVITMPLTVKSAENENSASLEVSPTPLPGNRPIDASSLQVLGTISVMGLRPIAASDHKIWDTMTVSGERPIYSSNLVISETRMIMGNRPIASNSLVGEENLMGYLD